MNYGKNDFPRFYARRLPRSFGLILSLTCGFCTVMIILAILEDTSIAMILVSIVMAIFFGLATIVGVLAVMAAYETIRVSPKGVEVMLGKLVLFCLPAKKIRSAVATTKEYRERMTDRQVYMVQIYWRGRHPQNLALWLQWSSAEVECFRRNLPNVDYLL